MYVFPPELGKNIFKIHPGKQQHVPFIVVIRYTLLAFLESSFTSLWQIRKKMRHTAIKILRKPERTNYPSPWSLVNKVKHIQMFEKYKQARTVLTRSLPVGTFSHPPMYIESRPDRESYFRLCFRRCRRLEWKHIGACFTSFQFFSLLNQAWHWRHVVTT